MAITVTIGCAILIQGDCLDHAPRLLAADALVTDPPYGIGYQVNRRRPRQTLPTVAQTATEPQPAIANDDRPFDPSPWLKARRMAFFGANYFADRLPPSAGWIVWDKRRDKAPDSHSDAELIWTNMPVALRIHRQLWRGIAREGEENCSRSRKLHRNQKPSGSTGIAALRAGLHFIGCEIDPGHFATARARFEAEFGQAAGG